MPTISAILDACVLIPAPLCDTLLRTAERDLYRVLWSEDILSEVERNLIQQLGVPPERAARRVRLMRESFDEALVADYEPLIPAMTNSAKDRHVLAAAIVSRSHVIVTTNLKDFPEESLQAYSIEAQSPDEFLMNLFDLHPGMMLQIVRDQVNALRSPLMSFADVLHAIARDAPRFAEAIRHQVDLP